MENAEKKKTENKYKQNYQGKQNSILDPTQVTIYQVPDGGYSDGWRYEVPILIFLYLCI